MTVEQVYNYLKGEYMCRFHDCATCKEAMYGNPDTDKCPLAENKDEMCMFLNHVSESMTKMHDKDYKLTETDLAEFLMNFCDP